MTVANTTIYELGGVKRAMAQLYAEPALRSKMIMVTGTDAMTGHLWPDANVFTGADSIAAPATGFWGTKNGTSFAAPMVAGVAAQLWTMDPTLTAAQVKQLIIDGAQVKRVDPETGDSVPAPHIGVPGIYQLDAYASLALLSRQRSNVPVCGLEVHGEGDGLVAERNAGPETIMSWPSGYQSNGTFSVAQGGRLVSIDAIDIGTNAKRAFTRVLQNGGWQSGPTLNGFDSRIYLEKDTAYLSSTSNWPTVGMEVRLRIEGDAASRDVAERVLFSGKYNLNYGGWVQDVSISPTGNWVYGNVGWGNYDTFGCQSTAGAGTYFEGLRGGATITVYSHSAPACDTVSWPQGRGGQVVWSGNGVAAWRFGDWQGTLDDTQFQPWTANGPQLTSGNVESVTGRSVHVRFWNPDGATLHTYEFTGPGLNSCVVNRRVAADPTVLVDSDQQCPDLLTEGPVLPFLTSGRTGAIGGASDLLKRRLSKLRSQRK